MLVTVQEIIHGGIIVNAKIKRAVQRELKIRWNAAGIAAAEFAGIAW